MPLRLEKFTFGQTRFLRTDDNSEQMAVDGRSTSAEDMWDGTGASDSGTENWTRSGIGSESTASKHSGTNGLDTGVASSGDSINFDYGSDRDLEASFDSVSFWMKPIAYPPTSNLRAMFRNSGTTTNVGAPVKVADYVSNMDLGVWNHVLIPLDDFGLTGNAGRFTLRTLNTAGQRFYFDTFELLNSTGDGPYRFRVAAPENTIWRVSLISLVLAASDSGWDSDAFATIAAGLENGLILRQRRLSESEVLWATVVKNNQDLFGKFIPAEPFAFGDNELQMVFAIEPRLATIEITDDEVLEFVLRDDLSTLNNMRSYLQVGQVIPDL